MKDELENKVKAPAFMSRKELLQMALEQEEENDQLALETENNTFFRQLGEFTSLTHTNLTNCLR